MAKTRMLLFGGNEPSRAFLATCLSRSRIQALKPRNTHCCDVLFARFIPAIDTDVNKAEW